MNVSLLVEQIDINILESILTDSFVDFCESKSSGINILLKAIEDNKYIDELINESYSYIIPNLLRYDRVLYEGTGDKFARIRSNVQNLGSNIKRSIESNVIKPSQSAFSGARAAISGRDPAVLSSKNDVKKIGGDIQSFGSKAFDKIKGISKDAAHAAFKKIEDSKYGQKVIDPILAGVAAAKIRRTHEINKAKPYAQWYPKLQEWQKEFSEEHPRIKKIVSSPVII